MIYSKEYKSRSCKYMCSNNHAFYTIQVRSIEYYPLLVMKMKKIYRFARLGVFNERML